jgi:hypothetical protein
MKLLIQNFEYHMYLLYKNRVKHFLMKVVIHFADESRELVKFTNLLKMFDK